MGTTTEVATVTDARNVTDVTDVREVSDASDGHGPAGRGRHGGVRPWLRLFLGISGGAVAIAVVLGLLVVATTAAAQAQTQDSSCLRACTREMSRSSRRKRNQRAHACPLRRDRTRLRPDTARRRRWMR